MFTIVSSSSIVTSLLLLQSPTQGLWMGVRDAAGIGVLVGVAVLLAVGVLAAVPVGV